MNSKLQYFIAYCAVVILMVGFAVIQAWREERAYQKRFQSERICLILNSRKIELTLRDVLRPKVIDATSSVTMCVMRP